MKYYVIDTFTDELFRGNPAGVCLVDKPLSDETMQKIAAENNLAETAFLTHDVDHYNLRWFTPTVEIDLCGHATLASAFVLMNEVDKHMSNIVFHTKSGPLTVNRENERYRMNFPARRPNLVNCPPELERAIGCKVLETYLSRDLLVIVEREQQVQEADVDIRLLAAQTKDIAFAVILSAAGDTCDFVSRFFAPNAGIDEDPVTGSSHSTLIPFWGGRLGKQKMTARQLSARGGTLYCKNLNDRVEISGQAVCYLTGNISL